MSKKLLFIIFFGFISSLNLQSAEEDKGLEEANNFLVLYENYKKIYDVHAQESQINRTLDRTNRVNFALKPYVAPIKSFDTMLVHHAYPLKIFLPSGKVVSSAKLSNSAKQPTFSQNTVTVEVTDEFESGLLDIVYASGSNISNGEFMSIKLDKYLPQNTSESLMNTPLYTQARYYASKQLNKTEILKNLEKHEYEQPHTQISYMGLIYDVFLTSIVENTKVIKRLKKQEFTNASILYNGKTYNYYIVQGELR
jgi:hypothetical protein